MATNTVKYISTDGLKTFLETLKTELAKSSGSYLPVAYATAAGSATNDVSGNPIATTYLKIGSDTSMTDATSEFAKYVPKTRTIAGVDLDDNITKSELLTALSVADGAQVNVLEKVKFKGNGDASASALTIDTSDKSVTIDVSDYALKSEVARVMEYKGSKTGAQLAAIASGTVTADMNGDVYTCSEESAGATDYKAGFEYVAVVSGTAPNLTLTFEELGKNFSGMASEQWVKDWATSSSTGGFLVDEDFLAAVKGVKVDAATAADSAAKLTTGRDVALTGDVTGSVSAWDGSTNLSITTAIAAGSIVDADVNANAAIAQTKIAGSAANTTLADDIGAKANKLTSTDAGKILKVSSTGDLEATGTAATVLEGGSVATNNTSFVTGGAVATAIAPKVDNTTTVNGHALSSNVTLDGSDVNLSTDYAIAQTATAPAANDSIDVAIGKLQKEIADATVNATQVYDDSSTPAHVDALYEATASDIAALFTVTPVTP